MLATAKTYVLMLVFGWAFLGLALMPLLGPWGVALAGAAATQGTYLVARNRLAQAPSLWAVGATFTAVLAIKLTIQDWRTHGAVLGSVETVCLAILAVVGAVWLVRRVKTVAGDFRAKTKASTLAATARIESAETERAQQRAGQPAGLGELGLRRSARLGSLTGTLIDHARKIVDEGRPTGDAVADIRKRLAKDPELLPLLDYNLSRRPDVDETVRTVAAALLAEVAEQPSSPL